MSVLRRLPVDVMLDLLGYVLVVTMVALLAGLGWAFGAAGAACFLLSLEVKHP